MSTGASIPREALRSSEAKLLDLGANPGYAPWPGPTASDYRITNRAGSGSQTVPRLYCLSLTGAGPVRVPTSDGFDLLVSPAEPESFLNSLNRPATAVSFPLSAAQAHSGSAIVRSLLGLSVLLPLGIAALFGYLAYSIRRVTFELSKDSFRVRGDIFGRTIARSSLRFKDAQILDLKKEKSHRPVLRTMGVGLPGYSSGWFRLRDKGKGLLFLSDPSRAVFLPTSDGYTLLLSPADPDRFLAALAS